MPSIRLDRVIFSSLHEAYKNSANASATINVGADVVLNLATKEYTVSIPYTAGSAIRADIYLDNGSVKMLGNSSTRLVTGEVYTFKSTETASILIDYYDNSIDVTLSIFNGTGGSITLTPQSIVVSLVEYDAPLTAI